MLARSTKSFEDTWLKMSTPMPTLPDPLVTATRDVVSGTPCFAGTRVPAKTLFDYLAARHPRDEFLLDFPDICREHAVAVLALAGAKVTTIPLAA
jgi:uncharacterized protein (DUF433 family)